MDRQREGTKAEALPGNSEVACSVVLCIYIHTTPGNKQLAVDLSDSPNRQSSIEESLYNADVPSFCRLRRLCPCRTQLLASQN